MSVEPVYIEAAGKQYHSHTVRAWGRSNGWPNVGDRGRLPKGLVAEFILDKENEAQGRKQKAAERNAAAIAKIQKPVKKQPAQQRKVSARRLGQTDPSLETKVKKPGCPMHKRALVLDEAENIWRCPEEGCVITAFPKNGGTKPLVGKGKLTLFRDSLNQFFLRSDNGVVMDITSAATNIEVEQGLGRGTIANVHLALILE